MFELVQIGVGIVILLAIGGLVWVIGRLVVSGCETALALMEHDYGCGSRYCTRDKEAEKDK